MEKLMSYMILMILIVTFIRTLLSIFFKLKIDTSLLRCGIIGFCGNRPADPNKIKLLMMFNMERGEDGTGWAVNNKIEKDTEKVSKFLSTHTLDSSEEDENFSVIAHARKCSSGTKLNKELVHPFGIYKDGVEKERYDLILAMNGTLTNTELIADAFEIEYKQWTNSDTQVLAKAIAKLGEKEYVRIIEGYAGTATLVFFTPKHANTMMVYRDPARDIFYWQKSKDEMYISSMEEALYSIGAVKDNVKVFEGEHLYRIVKGKITKKEKIERIPLKPKAVYKSNSNSHYHYNRNKNTYEAEIHGLPYRMSNVMSKNNVDKLEIYNENKKNPHSQKGNVVYVVSDRYYRNGHQLNGKILINDIGKVKDEPTSKNPELLKDTNVKQFFFVNGYLCKNEHNYNELIKKCSDQNGEFQLSKFKMILISDVSNYLMYPVITIVDRKEKWILNDEYKNKIVKVGDTIKLDMFLSTTIITLKYNGEWTKLTKKEVCDLVSITEKEVPLSGENINIEEILKRISREDQMKHLKDVIKNDDRASVRSNYYYSLMRVDVFKREPSGNLRLYYYNLLLELLFNEKILDNNKFSELKKEGGKSGFSSTEIIATIDKYLELFVNSLCNLKKEDEVNTINKEFTNAEMIKSLKLGNNLYNKEKFKDDIIDGEYDELNDIIITWANSDYDKDLRPLLEAILLLYNDIGYISEEELIGSLGNPINTLKSITGAHYLSYKKEFSEKSKEIINEINQLTGKENKENIEEEINESYNIRDYEEICKRDCQELVDSLKGYINGIDEVIEEELKSEWVKQSVNIVTDMVKFMERSLFINNLREKNEHK